ncbi:hypothetical protein [Enhygromyxa salina]|uniref:Uncharacterized protein n=1 Tax=Enhygromyxa salina TaxID=215803 RepID=A0A2S9YNJ9_9BACT|nr:hypothetical protein [Enhygromyxa salina]PRQ06639.1 hypothetical protein ENSA7_36600 [Enhygromyxa salina]
MTALKTKILLAHGPTSQDLTVASVTINRDLSVSMSASGPGVINWSSCAVVVDNQCEHDVYLTLTPRSASDNQCPVQTWAKAGNSNYCAVTYFGSDMDRLHVSCQLSSRVEDHLTGQTSETFNLEDQSCRITLDANNQPGASWTNCSAGSIYFDASEASGPLYYFLGDSQTGQLLPTSPLTGVAVDASTISSVTISTTATDPGAPGSVVVAIYDAQGSQVTLMQDPDDDTQTIAVPYAVTPAPDASGQLAVTVSVESLAVNVSEATVWRSHTSESSGTTLYLPGSGLSSTTFSVDDFYGNNLYLAWKEGGDPKVVIKSTGCDDGN